MPWKTSRRPGTAAIYRTPEHRRARAALLAAYEPGDPCCLCGRPMYPPTSQLCADHLPGTTEYRGLAHAACNRRDGSVRARQRQTTTARPM